MRTSALSLIVFFLVLVSPPLFLSVFRGKRFEETVAVSSGAVILVLFLCGVLGILEAGVYLVLGLALVLAGLSVYRFIRRRDPGALRAFFTPAFIAFCLIYGFLFFIHFQRLIHEWDEFTHWGDVVKAMTCVDAFSTSPQAHSLFQSYVPGMALFQYLFQKIAMLFNGGKFADWGLYFCYHLLAYTFLLPFFSARRWKHFLPSFLLTGCAALLPCFLQEEYMTSIYIDSFVGLLAGAGFALLFLKKRTPSVTALFLVICSMLVLAKDVGMMFAVMLVCTLLVLELRSGAGWKKAVLPVCLAAAVVAVPKILWEISIRVNHAEVRFRDPLDLGILFRVITGQDQSYRSVLSANYWSRLWSSSVPLARWTGISVSYPVLSAVLMAALLLALLLWRKAAPDRKRQQSVVCLMLVLTFAVYLAGMLVIYMFRFSPEAAEALPSFGRYLSIVFDCLLAAVFLLFAAWFREKPKRLLPGLAVSVLAVCLAVNPETFLHTVDRSSVDNTSYTQAKVASVVQPMLELADGQEKKVWIISQGSDGFDYWPIRYGIRPCEGALNVGWSLTTSSEKLYAGDSWTVQLSAEDWREKLKDFDYVLIYRVNDTFRMDYASLFEHPEELDNSQIYTVDHERDLLVRVY